MTNNNHTIYKAKISPRLFRLRLLKGSIRINEYGEIEKHCPRCGEYWPADSEFFALAKDKADGLSWQCKACKSEAEANSPRSHKKKQ